MSANAFSIALMPGDGIGREVLNAALHVLDAVEERFGVATRREVVEGGAHQYRDRGVAPRIRRPARRRAAAAAGGRTAGAAQRAASRAAEAW